MRRKSRVELVEESARSFAAVIHALKRIDALQTKLKQSGNYTADHEVKPTAVTFANGRTVKIVNGILDIGWSDAALDAAIKEQGK